MKITVERRQKAIKLETIKQESKAYMLYQQELHQKLKDFMKVKIA
jgi:hypothetical protein